ncbi:MAG: prepilin-type N-terminal cleavage/methylation domain-containing protein [Desulfatitalea sp.]|nr:prepilin-type N-terminal cleavage/methylation domain-containing protein [Desulfatitalea sp.]
MKRIEKRFYEIPANQPGFSLIEVMIALAVFSIVALALAAQATHTTNTNAAARRLTTAAITASNQVEHLFPYAHMYNDTRLADGIHTEAMDHTITTESGYTIAYEVRTNDALPRTKSVQVTVTWTEKGGMQRQTRFNYLIPEII